ncbi:hypothetical protein JCM10550A_04180 [Methanogenium cariaci]
MDEMGHDMPECPFILEFRGKMGTNLDICRITTIINVFFNLTDHTDSNRQSPPEYVQPDIYINNSNTIQRLSTSGRFVGGLGRPVCAEFIRRHMR